MGFTSHTDYKHTTETCTASINAVKDALYVLNGKWKLPLIISLVNSTKRFKEIQRDLENITPKILSKELKDLELNGFINREVFNTTPVTVTYKLTPYAKTLDNVIEELRLWGIQHRQHLIALSRQEQAV